MYNTTFENGHLYVDSSSIGHADFTSCIGVTTVTIGNSVRSISASAFEGMRVAMVIIGDNVRSIGYAAFQGCPNLHTVSFGGRSIRSISHSAFGHCPNLQNIIVRPTQPTDEHDDGDDYFYGGGRGCDPCDADPPPWCALPRYGRGGESGMWAVRLTSSVIGGSGCADAVYAQSGEGIGLCNVSNCIRGDCAAEPLTQPPTDAPSTPDCSLSPSTTHPTAIDETFSPTESPAILTSTPTIAGGGAPTPPPFNIAPSGEPTTSPTNLPDLSTSSSDGGSDGSTVTTVIIVLVLVVVLLGLGGVYYRRALRQHRKAATRQHRPDGLLAHEERHRSDTLRGGDGLPRRRLPLGAAAASSGMLHNPLFAPPACHGERRRPDALVGGDGAGSQSDVTPVFPNATPFETAVLMAAHAPEYDSVDPAQGSQEDQAYALPPGAEDAAGYLIPESNQSAAYAASRQDSVEDSYATVDAVRLTSIIPDHPVQDQVGIGAMAAQRLAELRQMQRRQVGLDGYMAPGGMARRSPASSNPDYSEVAAYTAAPGASSANDNSDYSEVVDYTAAPGGTTSGNDNSDYSEVADYTSAPGANGDPVYSEVADFVRFDGVATVASSQHEQARKYTNVGPEQLRSANVSGATAVASGRTHSARAYVNVAALEAGQIIGRASHGYENMAAASLPTNSAAARPLVRADNRLAPAAPAARPLAVDRQVSHAHSSSDTDASTS